MMSKDCPDTPSRGVDSSWKTSTSEARQHSPRRNLVTSGAGSCRTLSLLNIFIHAVAQHALCVKWTPYVQTPSRIGAGQEAV